MKTGDSSAQEPCVWSTWPCILINITVCCPHFLIAKCLNLCVTSPLETATSQWNQVTNYTSRHIITAVPCLLVVQNAQSRYNTTAPRRDNPPAVETKKRLIDRLHDTPDCDTQNTDWWKASKTLRWKPQLVFANCTIRITWICGVCVCRICVVYLCI